ncbi:DNA ligase 1-like [Euwallacea fornicatus]|uniref:DNA ligase 1-like n=1 Tax=Euwallacea fornicatus TaxID=995702 RepID=UPI00338F16A0
MTRFARAKGSKSSNEKLPEPATSWSEMKQDLLNKSKELEDKKQREEAMKRRQASYNAFLQEKEEKEHKNCVWADFPQTNGVGKKPITAQNNIKNKKPKRSLESDSSESDNEEYAALKSQIDKVLSKQECSQEHSPNIAESESDDEPPEIAGTKEEPKEVVIKNAKKKKLQLIINKEAVSQKLLSEREQRLIQKKQERFKKQSEKKKQLKKDLKAQEICKVEAEFDKQQVGESDADINLQIEKKLERRKKQKERKKLKHKSDLIINKQEDLDEETLQKIKKKKEKQIRQAERRRKARQEKAALKNNNNTFNGNVSNNQTDTVPENSEEKKPFEHKQPEYTLQQQKQKKQGKPRDNKQHHRKKLKADTLFINGKNVEIDYVDGFPVKKEDADRLRNLRKEMISKGLPRSEINASLKLERRRAEKAFAREKKNVCFKCRKSGHNLSECPELNKDQVAHTTGTGICFKCGSTEHTHFECKVVRGMDYKFASCFICKEQGHIAKQCPDNQRGLYPKGGACKVCGDVTHLKKDCPKFQTQQIQLQSCLSIGTLDNGNPDDMSAPQDKKFIPHMVKRPNKIIKF